MRKPRLLIAMITVGQGHKTAAEALASHLDLAYPDRFEIEVLDFTAAVGDIALDRRHKASWDAMLARPWTAFWGQRLVDRAVPASVSRWVQHRILADHARHAAPFIASREPDLVVATHFFTVQALGLARRRHGLAVPFVGLNPDPLDAHALWTEPAADEMIVFSDAARRDLVRRGIDPRTIGVFPYLLRPDFPVRCERASARETLGIDAGRLTILHTAGGQGIGGRVEETVSAVMELDIDAQYIVVCGHNERLKRTMEGLAATARGRTTLVATGFVTDIPRYICASDVVVGKAGPASTFEALISRRPVVHTSFAGANERAVLDFCVRRGVGLHIHEPRALARWLQAVAADPARLDRMRARIEDLRLTNGGPALAEHLASKYLLRTEGAGTAP